MISLHFKHLKRRFLWEWTDTCLRKHVEVYTLPRKQFASNDFHATDINTQPIQKQIRSN